MTTDAAEKAGYDEVAWYLLAPAQATARLEVTPDQGLSSPEAATRLAQHGPHELVERGGRSSWRIILEQLTGTLVLILIVAAVVSALVGDVKDAVAILAIVVLNAMLGFVQEYRAEQAMAALKRLAVPLVRVRREGQVVEVPAHDLVPGDVVLLEAGNLVPVPLPGRRPDGDLRVHRGLVQPAPASLRS
jgi:P-type Ca2+ transporter type 2C